MIVHRLFALAFATASITGAASALVALPATAQQLSIPLVANFEDPKDKAYFDNIARDLSGSVVDGRLIVESTRNYGSTSESNYDFPSPDPRSTFVDVTADFSSLPPTPDGKLALLGPGLIIRSDAADRPSYFALLLQQKGYLIFSVVNGGLGQNISGSLTAETLARPVHLAARETATGAEFYVNGENVATISDSNLTGRRVGLIVFGSGKFTFDNFGINLKGDVGAR